MAFRAVCVDTEAGVWRVIERATGRVVAYGLPRWMARDMARRLNRSAA